MINFCWRLLRTYNTLMEKAVPAFLQNTYLYQLPVKIVGAKDEPDGMLL